MRARLHVDGGFCLLLLVLLFLDDENLLPWGILACILHELGHWLAIRLIGGRVERLSLSMIGAEMIPQRARLFSYCEELFLAAAGPAASLSAALLGAVFFARGEGTEAAFLFVGLNLAAGLFNLLPIGPLDGARMLRALLLRRLSPQEVEGISRVTTLIFGLALLGLGLWQLLRLGGNLSLLLCSTWLLWPLTQKMRHNNKRVRNRIPL